MLHGIDLFANGVSINAQQIVTPAAKFRCDMHVIIVVKNRLLHMQLIGVRIQQRLQ